MESFYDQRYNKTALVDVDGEGRILHSMCRNDETFMSAIALMVRTLVVDGVTIKNDDNSEVTKEVSERVNKDYTKVCLKAIEYGHTLGFIVVKRTRITDPRTKRKFNQYDAALERIVDHVVLDVVQGLKEDNESVLPFIFMLYIPQDLIPGLLLRPERLPHLRHDLLKRITDKMHWATEQGISCGISDFRAELPMLSITIKLTM